MLVLIKMDRFETSVSACFVQSCCDGLEIDDYNHSKMRKSKVNSCGWLWYIAIISIVNHWRIDPNVLFIDCTSDLCLTFVPLVLVSMRLEALRDIGKTIRRSACLMRKRVLTQHSHNSITVSSLHLSR